MKAPALIIKEAAAIAQIVACPFSNSVRQRYGLRKSLAQFDQRHDRGSGRVRIRRVESIRKILWPAVLKKKSLAPEFITTPKSIIELFLGTSRVHDLMRVSRVGTPACFR